MAASPTSLDGALAQEEQSTTIESRSTTERSATTEETDYDAMDVDCEDMAQPEASSATTAENGLDANTTQLHLLARPDPSTPFCLPVVCLASYDTIFEVLASALQQRRAWGLADVPVLGLAFHPYSTRIQPFWGWFDSLGVSGDACVVCLIYNNDCLRLFNSPIQPIPRVAFNASPICATVPSLFEDYDVSDHTSALALARFLSSLQPQYEALRCAGEKALSAGLAHGEPTVWRSDTPLIRVDSLTAYDRVRRWLERAESPEADEGIIPPPPSAMSGDTKKCFMSLHYFLRVLTGHRSRKKRAKEPAATSSGHGTGS